MRISDFAKELTKETGKQVTPNQIIMLLSKKKDGLRALSNIDDDLMEYARLRITGKTPTKAAAPAAKPAAKGAKPTAKSGTKKPAGAKTEGTKTDKSDAAKKPSASTRTGAARPVRRPGLGRLSASTRPDAVIVPKPQPKAPEKKHEEEVKEAAVEEVKTEVQETATVSTQNSNLNLRAEPSQNSRIIARIPNGSKIQILGNDGNWYLTLWNGSKGYVSGDYLQF